MGCREASQLSGVKETMGYREVSQLSGVREAMSCREVSQLSGVCKRNDGLPGPDPDVEAGRPIAHTLYIQSMPLG